jgi:hypothetical protein
MMAAVVAVDGVDADADAVRRRCKEPGTRL